MTDKPEFSRLQPVDVLDDKAQVFTIEANADERAALARRLNLSTLDSMVATLELERLSGTDVRLRGQFEATLTQPCSVTLEPVADDIAATVERFYVAGAETAGEAGGEVDSPDDAVLEIDGLDAPEPPEPLIDGAIDLGEVVAEQLALEINPFPRKKDVEFEDVIESTEGDTRGNNPFQALAKLKPGNKS